MQIRKLRNLPRDRGRISIGGSESVLGVSGQLKYVIHRRGSEFGLELLILQKKLPELMMPKLGGSEAIKLK
ncbi:hypothetical protein MTR67_050790 [Solanum verrucosum]|uniref:Uncharacterized protein n=1 Tax=Solanum verrucosum TaxID=315347 RepID=A0AAF0V3X4_SOLVR|nr:hypothetical protein MTR67_050790 [Solanum verrucosum]